LSKIKEKPPCWWSDRAMIWAAQHVPGLSHATRLHLPQSLYESGVNSQLKHQPQHQISKPISVNFGFVRVG